MSRMKGKLAQPCTRWASLYQARRAERTTQRPECSSIMAKALTEIIVKLPDQTEHGYVLDSGEYVVGRDPSCQIRVDSPDVSQRHARLRLTGEELWLEDLGSSNGIFVAGERLTNSVRLRPPQRIQLGNVVLEIQRVEEGGKDSAVASAASSAADLPGFSVRGERYTVGSLIAQGGMGAVLAAQDVKLQRRVALKRLRSGKQASRESLLRLVQEARVLGQLEHPNIVPIHDLDVREDGELFYTMKFVRGVTLHQVLAKIKAGDAPTVAKYPLAQLLTIFQKVCDAVSFAHSRGVLHRDLKPANIMLGDFGEVLVMDWGLAKILTPEGPPQNVLEALHEAEAPASEAGFRTLEGRVMGTPNFMAPEQADGRIEEIDFRTDVFALGGILYHILTLSPPVSGASAAEVLEKIKQGAIPPPSTYNQAAARKEAGREVSDTDRVALLHCPDRKVPEALSAVAMKALAREPSQRYQTVAELQRDVAAYQGGFATSAEEAGTWKLLTLAIKRRKTEFSLIAASLLIILAVAAGFLWKVTRTLGELRKAAPLFYAEAQSLVDERGFNQALDRIDYALSLKPGDANYHYLRGNIHQSLFQFDLARDDYLQALRYDVTHALASENLLLCQKILGETKGAKTLSLATLHDLRMAMLKQGRFAEALAIAARIGKKEQQFLDQWRTVLTDAGVSGTLTNDPDGLLRLDLRGSPIRDLTPLRRVQLTMLDLSGCTNVTDLKPLQGMPLRVLELGDCPVSDLSPLKGMPLIRLVLNETRVTEINALKGMQLRELFLIDAKVSDISALKGMPLGFLNLWKTQVTDLAPLQGMSELWWLGLAQTPVSDLRPLQGLHVKVLTLHACLNLQDVSPLAECKQLDILTIPAQAKNIESLRRLPLHQLGASTEWDTERIQPAADFWREYDAKKK